MLLARGDPRRALAALGPSVQSTEWPLGTDARLCQAEAMLALGQEDEAREILAREKELSRRTATATGSSELRSVAKSERYVFSGDAVERPTSAWQTRRSARPTARTRSSTTGRPGSCSSPASAKARWRM